MAYVVKSVCLSPEEAISIGEGIDHSYTKRYDVVLDAATTEVAISCLQLWEALPTQLPRYNDIWRSPDGLKIDNVCVMRTFTGRRDHTDKMKFSFTFNYKPIGSTQTPSDPSQRTHGGGSDNIDHIFPTWSLSTEDRMYPLETDLDGKKIVNSAGDPYDPMPEFNDPIVVLNWSRYETDYDGFDEELLYADVRNYKYATNSDVFFQVGDENNWLIAEYKLVPEMVGARRVIKRDITFKHSTRGWKDKLLDAGLWELKDTSDSVYEPAEGMVPARTYTNKKQILHPVTRQPVTRPWPLDGRGAKLTDLGANNLVYRSYRTKTSVPFAPLGIFLI